MALPMLIMFLIIFRIFLIRVKNSGIFLRIGIVLAIKPGMAIVIDLTIMSIIGMLITMMIIVIAVVDGGNRNDNDSSSDSGRWVDS